MSDESNEQPKADQAADDTEPDAASVAEQIRQLVEDAPDPIKGIIRLALAGQGRAIIAVGSEQLMSDMTDDAAADVEGPHDQFLDFLDSLTDDQLTWVHALLHVASEENRWHFHGMVTLVERERELGRRSITDRLTPAESGKWEKDERIDPDSPRGEGPDDSPASDPEVNTDG